MDQACQPNDINNKAWRICEGLQLELHEQLVLYPGGCWEVNRMEYLQNKADSNDDK